jgi:hypothetical protein
MYVDHMLAMLRAIDCHCIQARRALRHGPVPRRPDPTPDKINEAFKRATRG